VTWLGGRRLALAITVCKSAFVYSRYISINDQPKVDTLARLFAQRYREQRWLTPRPTVFPSTLKPTAPRSRFFFARLAGISPVDKRP
jgi:hypothetical protein